jgi:UDP-2-acetamido-3-amino-2,3-dideoxy-glucuronate N-acetyltransferase
MVSKRVCVVGAGRWGKNHVRTLASLQALGGVVESCSEQRAELVRQYPGVPVLASLEEAWKYDFDGFTVATPAHTHFDIASTIISARKSLLVEKPLTLTSKEARVLGHMAMDAGVKLMVGHVLLFHPAIRTLKMLIDDGKIGKLQYIYSNRLNLGTVRKEENILWSFAPHDISVFQYFTEQRPLRVRSHGGMFLQPGIHDSTMTTLEYPSGAVGHIFVSWLHPYKEHKMVLVGSKGMVSFEDSSEGKELLFYEKGIDWVAGEPVKRDGPTEIIEYPREQPLTNELAYFIAALDGAPVEISGQESAIEVLEILESASDDLMTSPVGGSSSAPVQVPEYFVHESSFVDEGVRIGDGTKVWHFSHVCGGASIGSQCTLGQNVFVGPKVKIGDYVKIQNNVSVYEGVTLDSYVFCGPSVVFTNVMDPRSKYPQRGSQYYKKTHIQEGASLGANSTIVCGTSVGRHAFVAAGAVVTKDVPDYALMKGVPARRSAWVCECGEQLTKLRKVGDEQDCTRCGLPYLMVAQDRIQLDHCVRIPEAV